MLKYYLDKTGKVIKSILFPSSEFVDTEPRKGSMNPITSGGVADAVEKGADAAASNLAPEYSATATYPGGSYVVHEGVLYTNPVAITTAEAWNPAHWTQTTISNVTGDVAIFDSWYDSDSGQWVFPDANDVWAYFNANKLCVLRKQLNQHVAYHIGFTANTNTNEIIFRDPSESYDTVDTVLTGTTWSLRTASAGYSNSGALAPDYSSTATYAVGDYCMHDGYLYYCSASGGIATSEPWTPAHWTGTNVVQMVAGIKIGYTTKNLAAMSGGNYHIPVKNRECVNVSEIGYSGVSSENRHLTIELENDCTDAVINILKISLANMKGMHWTFEVTRGNNTLPMYGFDNYADYSLSLTPTDMNILCSSLSDGSGYIVPDDFSDVYVGQAVEDGSIQRMKLSSKAYCAICLEVKGDVVIVHQIDGTSF